MKNVKSILIIAVFAFALLLVSCGAAGDATSPSNPSNGTFAPIIGGTTVYTVGMHLNGSGDTVACCWKNGELLPDFAQAGSIAKCVAVAPDSTVYIAGIYYIGELPQACYWANGKKTDLAPLDSQVTGIAIGPDGAVYISGFYNANPYDVEYRACYWKDGKKTDLADSFSYTDDIAIDKYGAVYCAGTYWNGSEQVACYWKDTKIGAVLAYTNSCAYAIAIDPFDGAVYTAGFYSTGDNVGSSCYWKNDEKVHDIGDPIQVMGIAIDPDGAVYIAGMYFADEETSAACWWIDGVRQTDLEMGNAGALDLAIGADGSVYIAGYYAIGENEIACYWVNGSRKTDNSYGDALGITVVER